MIVKDFNVLITDIQDIQNSSHFEGTEKEPNKENRPSITKTNNAQNQSDKKNYRKSFF